MEYFLGLGILNARKGLDIILDSYGLYEANGGKAALVLIVAGRLRAAIEELIKKFDLSDVFLVSDIDFLERDALYQCALALLFPSRCEGFGYPVVEAMRQGCPPIAWQGTPAKEIVGETVPLLKLLDPKEVADQMRAYEDITPEERRVIAGSLTERSFLFDGTTFGRNFFNAMTRGWQ
ncbi:MAG: glycosyltransferase [Actinobacteria bacterium]|nr:glycosyltransferase [Actinomycetota bacterium]